jgi:hypothetical protein
MSILATMAPSIGNGPDKPCLKALRLELNRPLSVFGPVLSLALARLAAICFAVATGLACRTSVSQGSSALPARTAWEILVLPFKAFLPQLPVYFSPGIIAFLLLKFRP